MEVRRSFRLFLALLASPLLISPSIQAFDISSEPETQLLAGAIGKSSSASARVTLVIPPRPQSASQPKTSTADKNQTKQSGQKTNSSKSSK